MPRFCSSCGSALNEGSKFCRSCGTPTPSASEQESAASAQEADSGQPVMQAPPAAAVQTRHTASAPVTQFDVKTFLAGLSKGQKLVGGGAAAAAVAFFLPQYGYGGSGFTIGGAYSVRLLVAAVLLVLVYLFQREETAEKRLTLAAGQLVAASLFAGEILAVVQGGTGTGHFLMTVGFVVAVVGAFLEIKDIGRALGI